MATVTLIFINEIAPMNLFTSYNQAAKASGRTLSDLILEALRLRFSYMRLGLSEYIDFQLYREDLTFSEKAAFGGLRTQSVLEEILIDD